MSNDPIFTLFWMTINEATSQPLPASIQEHPVLGDRFFLCVFVVFIQWNIQIGIKAHTSRLSLLPRHSLKYTVVQTLSYTHTFVHVKVRPNCFFIGLGNVYCLMQPPQFWHENNVSEGRHNPYRTCHIWRKKKNSAFSWHFSLLWNNHFSCTAPLIAAKSLSCFWDCRQLGFITSCFISPTSKGHQSGHNACTRCLTNH